MVKRKKNQNRKGQESHGRRKKRKQERYWIENCGETLSSSKTGDFTLWITRADLHDAHQSGQQKSSLVQGMPLEENYEEAERAIAGGDDYAKVGVQKTINETDEPARSTEPVSAIGEGTINDDPAASADNEVSETLQSREASVPPNRDPVICVKKAESAKLPLKVFKGSSNFAQLPNGDCGDGIINPYPKSQVADKYWAQRKRLFTRFDDGIRLDPEGWFSVTPEAIANHIAEQMVSSSEGLTVLDAFVGVGGNAIAFAKRPEVLRVVCVDIDNTRLQLAANNCRVYDVPHDKVVFILADAFDVLAHYQDGKLVTRSRSVNETQMLSGYKYGGPELLPDRLDAIFLSPPWGGSDYEKVGRRNYDLSCIKLGKGGDGNDLLQKSVEALPHKQENIAYFLPRNANGVSVGRSAYKTGLRECIFEQNILNNKLKTITMYTRIQSIN